MSSISSETAIFRPPHRFNSSKMDAEMPSDRGTDTLALAKSTSKKVTPATLHSES